MARNRGNTPTARWGISRSEAAAEGYRSSYECAVARRLRQEGIVFAYELTTFPIQLPAGRSYVCPTCKERAVKETYYTPDFFFNDGSFVVEAKGRFDPGHRTKALAFKEQYPDIEYALLFEADNKLSPKSQTRYTEWCEKHGILCAVGLVPPAWLKEIR